MVITFQHRRRLSPLQRLGVAVLVAVGLAGCAGPDLTARGVNDPYESDNRRVHAFNKAVDREVVRPVLGTGVGTSQVLGPVRTGVRNVGETLDTPRRILNNALQGRVADAGHNSFRLAANLVFGLGGLLDVASDMGIEERDTDFGETLAVWGTEEGPYLEVPILGPSTTRDTIGDVMDAALNPVGRLLSGDALLASRVVRVGGEVADYSRAAATIGEVLDTSADSYLIARQAWLQNRRFELERNARRARGEGDGFVRASAVPEGGATGDPVPTSVDPFADSAVLDGAPAGGVDPYSDLPPPSGGVDPFADLPPPSGGVDPFANDALTDATPPALAEPAVDPYEDLYAQ